MAWDEFTTQNLHTNFKLNKTGEEIGLFQAEESENITLIGEGALWKYLDNGSNQGSDWFEIDFNDDDWSIGNAELGMVMVMKQQLWIMVMMKIINILQRILDTHSL